jgi:hypothetical protein
MPLAGFCACELDPERVTTLPTGITDLPFATHFPTLREERMAELLNAFAENSGELVRVNHEMPALSFRSNFGAAPGSNAQNSVRLGATPRPYKIRFCQRSAKSWVV